MKPGGNPGFLQIARYLPHAIRWTTTCVLSATVDVHSRKSVAAEKGMRHNKYPVLTA